MRLLVGFWLALVAGVFQASPLRAEDLKLAVASNFGAPIKELADDFERRTGHQVLVSLGSTGQFYAQITQGAPFDVFIAADKSTPAKAIAEGFGVEGSAFTYAVGRLVLYSALPGRVSGPDALTAHDVQKVAIANPATAPYGAAAVEVMNRLGVAEALKSKLVTGQNIAQTYQFVETGNAEIGFVALSQVISTRSGSRWLVPEEFHQPILQDAVLLKPATNKESARAFMGYLRSEQARTIIAKFGYKKTP